MIHKDLEVWKSSIQLVTEIYEVTKSFPKEEMYGLTSQIRRASVSIPANLAEGAARKNTKEYIQFVYISLGSISELETLLIISKNLGYLSEEPQLFQRTDAIRKMLSGLAEKLKKIEKQ